MSLWCSSVSALLSIVVTLTLLPPSSACTLSVIFCSRSHCCNFSFPVCKEQDFESLVETVQPLFVSYCPTAICDYCHSKTSSHHHLPPFTGPTASSARWRETGGVVPGTTWEHWSELRFPRRVVWNLALIHLRQEAYGTGGTIHGDSTLLR